MNHDDHVPRGLYYFMAISTAINIASIGSFLWYNHKSQETRMERSLTQEFSKKHVIADKEGYGELRNMERYQAFVHGKIPKSPIYNTTKDLEVLVEESKKIKRKLR